MVRSGDDFTPASSAAPCLFAATKFAPLPWRFTSESVVLAAKESLARMGLPSMALYMIHW